MKTRPVAKIILIKRPNRTELLLRNNYWMRFCDILDNLGRGKGPQPQIRFRLITLTETLVILYITKTESNNSFLYLHCFNKNNNERTVTRNTLR